MGLPLLLSQLPLHSLSLDEELPPCQQHPLWLAAHQRSSSLSSSCCSSSSRATAPAWFRARGDTRMGLMACRQCCASGHGSARVAATSLVQRMDALLVEATWQLEGQQNQPMWRWQGYCWP